MLLSEHSPQKMMETTFHIHMMAKHQYSLDQLNSSGFVIYLVLAKM
jgi:hypothetical protein